MAAVALAQVQLRGAVHRSRPTKYFAYYARGRQTSYAGIILYHFLLEKLRCSLWTGGKEKNGKWSRGLTLDLDVQAVFLWTDIWAKERCS